MADSLDLDVISPQEAGMRLRSGNFLADGSPGPAAVMVDTQAPPAQSPIAPSQAQTRGAPAPLLEPGDVSIKSRSERDTLMGHLKSASLPGDIAVTVAQAIKNYDDNYEASQTRFRAQQDSLGVLGRFGQAVGNDADAHIEASRQIGDTGLESGIRAVENLGQLGLNTLNFVTGGKEMRPALIAGFPGSTKDVRDFNALTVQRRQDWADDMAKKYGDSEPFVIGANLGAGLLSAPLFMSRAGMVLKGAEGTGLVSTLGQESARMAAFTGSDFDPKAISLLDKAGPMTVGALFPVTAAAVGAAWDVGKAIVTVGSSPGTGMVSEGLKNNLVRTILRRQDPESTRGAAQATDFFSSVGVTPANDTPLSLGQQTGDPRIISYENRFTDVQTRDFSKTQNNDLLNAAQALRDQLNSAAGGSGVAGVGAGTYNAIDKVDGAIRLQRVTDWNNGVDNVNNVADAVRSATGAPVTFPITNTVKTVNDVVKDLNNPAAMSDPAIKSRLNSLAVLLNDAQSKGGKFTPQGLMGMLQGLNAGKIYGSGAAGGAPGGADAALEAIRSKVMDAVYTDAAAAGTTAQPVATAIADMRARYAQQSEALRRLQNDTMTKLFGNADVMSDPASATDAFLKLDPSAQNYGVQILRERAPQVLYGMQSRMIENAINAATDPTKAAMAGQFDIKAFSDSLYGSGAVRSGIFTSDTLKQVEDAKGYISSIMNNKNSIVRPGTQIWPEDIAINLISRSPEFLARAVTRVMTGLNAEKLFVTPEGINALKTVSNLRSAPKEAATAAALYLGGLMEDSNRQVKMATDAAAASQHAQDARTIGK